MLVLSRRREQSEITAYQILAFVLMPLEKKIAPAIVVWKTSFPFGEPSLHFGILAV